MRNSSSLIFRCSLFVLQTLLPVASAETATTQSANKIPVVRHLVVPTEVGGVYSDYYPALLARGAEPADTHLSDLLVKVGDALRGPDVDSSTAELRRDELKAALVSTPIVPEQLIAIAIALIDEGGAEEIRLGHFILRTVEMAVENTLASRTHRDPDTARQLGLLRRLIDPVVLRSDWVTLERIYVVLNKWGPQDFRDQLKLADALHLNGKSKDALRVLDLLIHDVKEGRYPNANIKDAGELTWPVARAAGEVVRGIEMLSDLAGVETHDGGQPNRMRPMLVKAYSEAGQVSAAKEELATWIAEHAGTGKEPDKRALSALTEMIAMASWRQSNGQPPVVVDQP